MFGRDEENGCKREEKTVDSCVQEMTIRVPGRGFYDSMNKRVNDIPLGHKHVCNGFRWFRLWNNGLF